MAIYDFFLSRNSAAVDAANYIGHAGRLFYDSDNGVIKLSDGVTPGGTFIPYNIATETTVGGIKAGPGANVSLDGTLTIDISGLPLGIGNVSIIDTTISTVNANDDLILASNGTGNVNIVGEFKVYRTNGNLSSREPEFSIASDGQIVIRVPNVDPLLGAVEIIGSNSSSSISPAVGGVMLHITGNNDEFATVYTDGVNNFSNYIGRRFNGNVSVPTQVLAGQTICRFSATGYGTSLFPAGAAASIGMVALENFTDTAQGAKIEFLVAPIGSLTRELVANVTVADGLTATKATVLGNLTVLGNIVGNTVATTATLGSLTVTGNISGDRFIGNGALISNITGGNVTGTVSTATNLSAAASILAGSVSIDPTSVAGTSSSTQTFTLNGLTTNHKIVITSGTALDAGLIIQSAWASALNTISIQFYNTTNQPIDAGAKTIQYFAWV